LRLLRESWRICGRRGRGQSEQAWPDILCERHLGLLVEFLEQATDPFPAGRLFSCSAIAL